MFKPVSITHASFQSECEKKPFFSEPNSENFHNTLPLHISSPARSTWATPGLLGFL